ncbi:MAG: glycosyltransferase family 2 protein [Bacteroidota bacterium]|jgi:glycosyltransferase involved in cell wall biosynthesis
MKISIIIPVYNEEANILPLFTAVQDVISENNYDAEIIFIDDGSSDKTVENIKSLKSAKLIRFRKNFGQTAAMSAGIDFASGEIIIPMDGDLQNDPKDIPKLLAKLEEGYDVVSGWRKDRKDNPIKRNLPSRIANGLISYISGVHLHDYGCSLKAYRKEVIKDVKLYGEMHRFIPVYANWMGGKVTEVPVTHHPRVHGVSKYGINRTFKVVLDLIVIKFLQRYAQKSIHIFGGLGLLSFLFSFISAAVMFYYKIWGGKSFIQTPLPMLVVLFFMVGVMLVMLGLISEILNRTYYESQGKKVYMVKESVGFEHHA